MKVQDLRAGHHLARIGERDMPGPMEVLETARMALPSEMYVVNFGGGLVWLGPGSTEVLLREEAQQ